MYDTLHTWLPLDQMGAINSTKICEHLDKLTEHNQEQGSTYISGMLKDQCKVTLGEHGLSFKGSLAKYYLGDNIQTLTRSDTERAIQKLSDELNVPMHRATVTRLDSAQNLIVKHEPEAYYYHLGDSRYFQRLVQPHSVYWQNKNRQKLFYNKAEETGKKQAMPNALTAQNILRFEMRYTKRLGYHFKQPTVVVEDLFDESFYIKMVEKWVKEYESINKINTINLNYSMMDTPKDFRDQLALQAIRDMGGENKALQLVERLRAMGAFKRIEYYSRAKRNIKDLCRHPETTNGSELIAELDKKVRRVKKCCR